MSKARNKLSDLAYEAVATGLVEALERGTTSWPLPNPPISDPDFPPIMPISPNDIVELGLGMMSVDRGMFESILDSVVDQIVPHRMNLSDDPFETHNKWLERRIDKVAERLLFSIALNWLSQAFDPAAPNVDRWWLAIALIDGLSTVPRGQSVHQGYHLIESIALAERPGTWHTQPEAGPHNLDWNPNAIIPRSTSVVAHQQGVEAAKWLLARLEGGNDDRRLLVIEWTRLLLQRAELVEPLGLPGILLRRASDPNEEVAVKTSLCLARLLEVDKEAGIALAQRLHKRDEVLVKRAMADVLTRLFRRIGPDAIPFLEDMLQDDDEIVLAIAATTVSDLRFIDTAIWADKVAILSKHKLPIVRRNLVVNLRDYISEFPDDERGILTTLWHDGDEVVRTRLRELLLRMEEVDPQNFATRITHFRANNVDLQELWAPLKFRRENRYIQWIAWLEGNGEMPSNPLAPSPHQSSHQESGELIELGDALDVLDQELGFID
jgi:hypothetical protein